MSVKPRPTPKYQIRRSGHIVEKATGKIEVFGSREFMEKIVRGECCFICGAEPGTKPFNNEHVIPQWLLKLHRAHTNVMILPNETTINYGFYVVPCCQECNSEMSAKLEVPVSNLLKGGYDKLMENIDRKEKVYRLLFQWLCLLFFKTHYKDTLLLSNQDTRKSTCYIGHHYDWYPLYLIHRMARLHYSDARPSHEVYGSLVVLRAKPNDFDYLDNLNDQIMFVQVGDILLMAALTDSQACLALYKTFLSRINGPMNAIQIRELFARFRFVVANLVAPPWFEAKVKRDIIRFKSRIRRSLALCEGEEQKVSLFKLMRAYLEALMPKGLPNRQQLIEDLEEGRAQYIMDCEGRFHEYPD